ncbi:Growth/differentiation factor 6 [Collichthys lucidus]|uniref:Growth/differentiation factor 6 n=1 Tax=Collichthys lucidus TaxID=240159 RepID=A0A4U5V8R4_COLLU|nr:Growth/differentiation factor 6 [Collichthys lucidus]
MSFTFIVMTVLLGSSMAIAFILQPSKEEPVNSPNNHSVMSRCQVESLQSIRKVLLRALNLQVEPQLPASGLDRFREQWSGNFIDADRKAKHTAVPAVSGYSTSPDGGNSTSLKCCSMVSEIPMKDLGWDTWMIHPVSLTVVQCALCNPEVNPVQCVQNPDAQPPLFVLLQVTCCQPTSQKMVPVLYMDELATLTISSMQLTNSCGCGYGNIQQPSEE